MSLTTGRYWIRPLEKDDMATALGKSFRLDAKGKIQKRPPRMAGHERKRIEGKAKREAAQWAKKSK